MSSLKRLGGGTAIHDIPSIYQLDITKVNMVQHAWNKAVISKINIELCSTKYLNVDV